MTELILSGKTYSVDPRYLQGALAALIDLGWSGISVDHHYSRVYQVVPSPEKSTVLLNQTAYQFPRNDKVAQQFLTGARGVYQILGQEFSGRIYYNNNPPLNKDVLGVIAANASPMTQLKMKHVAKTKLSPHVQEYERLFREKNYNDLLILAANDGDIETIGKVLLLNSKPMLRDVESDFEIIKDVILGDSVILPEYLMHFANPSFLPMSGLRIESPGFCWNNEAAAIAVSLNRLDILKLLFTYHDPPNNLIGLIQIASHLGFDEIIEYLMEQQPDIPKMFIASFAIRGGQLNTLKKFLPQQSMKNIPFISAIWDSVYKYGTLEIYEYVLAAEVENKSYLRDTLLELSQGDNEVLFRYLYRKNLFVIYDEDQDADGFLQRFIDGMKVRFGMIDELKNDRLKRNVIIKRSNLLDALYNGHRDIVDYIINDHTGNPIEIEADYSFFNAIRLTISLPVIEDLIHFNLLGIAAQSAEARSFLYFLVEKSTDWRIVELVAEYLDIPLTQLMFFEFSLKSVELLRLYHSLYPKHDFSIIQSIDDVASLEVLREYERLYGPINMVKNQDDISNIFDCDREIIIYLIRSGKIEKSPYLYRLFKDHIVYLTGHDSIEGYIYELHNINLVSELYNMVTQ
jgi:hypothetical protein